MDQLLSERDPVNRELRRIIDELAEGPWGIRVERVEIKDVSLPDAMKWSMSRQAGAERERRARIITADGEYQASKRLAAAANVMARDPAALQLRLLQAVVEVASERNSALVMPVPVELLRFFDKMTPAGPGAGLSPSLADFGDAEVAKAEAAIEGRPSAAGPPDAMPPVEAPGIKGSPDHRGRGASRMAVGGCRDLPGRLRTGKGHRERESARIRERLARGQARRAGHHAAEGRSTAGRLPASGTRRRLRLYLGPVAFRGRDTSAHRQGRSPRSPSRKPGPARGPVR
jgi:hypothetical protein